MLLFTFVKKCYKALRFCTVPTNSRKQGADLIRIRMDPYYFKKLDLDPDPHSSEKLDLDLGFESAFS
jgi:hypothetical protein